MHSGGSKVKTCAHQHQLRSKLHAGSQQGTLCSHSLACAGTILPAACLLLPLSYGPSSASTTKCDLYSIRYPIPESSQNPNQEGWHFFCERGCARDDHGKAGPFSVERLELGLPDVNVSCAQKSAQRSAGPLGAFTRCRTVRLAVVVAAAG